MRPISLKLFSSEGILELSFSSRFLSIDIHDISDVDTDDISVHFVLLLPTYLLFAPFIGCLLYLRDSREK